MCYICYICCNALFINAVKPPKTEYSKYQTAPNGGQKSDNRNDLLRNP